MFNAWCSCVTAITRFGALRFWTFLRWYIIMFQHFWPVHTVSLLDYYIWQPTVFAFTIRYFYLLFIILNDFQRWWFLIVFVAFTSNSFHIGHNKIISIFGINFCFLLFYSLKQKQFWKKKMRDREKEKERNSIEYS